MGYRLSGKADDDIIDVYVTGVRLFGVAQAERYQEGLERVFEFLSLHPLAARERIEITPPVRVHRYKAHVVVYVLDEQDVFILRIRHGREDWIGDPAAGAI